MYPDVEGVHAIAQKSIPIEPIEALVPKNHKNSFNRELSVVAEFRIDEEDLTKLAERCKSKYSFQIEAKTFLRKFFSS